MYQEYLENRRVLGGSKGRFLGEKHSRANQCTLSLSCPGARTMLLMNSHTEKLPQGLRKANACGGDVRRKDGYTRRLQSPTKQESLTVRSGVPWVYPWGDVNHIMYSLSGIISFRIYQRHLLQVMQTSQLLPKNIIFPLFNNQMCAQTQGMYDE